MSAGEMVLAAPGATMMALLPLPELDEDVGCPGIAVLVLGDLGNDARIGPCLEGHVGERIAPQTSDEMDVPAGAGRRHRLVGSLAARAELEAFAENGFAHARLALGTVGRIGDEDAEDNDSTAHCCNPYSSGGMTPLRNMKQP